MLMMILSLSMRWSSSRLNDVISKCCVYKKAFLRIFGRWVKEGGSKVFFHGCQQASVEVPIPPYSSSLTLSKKYWCLLEMHSWHACVSMPMPTTFVWIKCFPNFQLFGSPFLQESQKMYFYSKRCIWFYFCDPPPLLCICSLFALFSEFVREKKYINYSITFNRELSCTHKKRRRWSLRIES